MTDIILAAIVFMPLVLAFLLKSNGALTFMAVCVGYVLTSYASSDFNTMLEHFGIGTLGASVAGLILLGVPLLLTLLFTRKSIVRSSLPIHAVSLLCAGFLAAIAAAPFLTEFSVDPSSSAMWKETQQFQGIIIGIGAVFSLVLVWMMKTKHHDDKKKKH